MRYQQYTSHIPYMASKPHLTVACTCLETGDVFTLKYYPRTKPGKEGDFQLFGKAVLNGVRFRHVGYASQDKKDGSEQAVPAPVKIFARPRNGAVSV